MGKMAADRRKPLTKALVLDRRARAWHLLTIERLTQDEIARRLRDEGLGPITQQGVSKILERCYADYRARHRVSIDRETDRQLAALDHQYGEAMREWAKSKEAATLLRQRESRDGAAAAAGGEPAAPRRPDVETTKEVRGQCGDPRYLAEARRTLEDVRKILGLDAAPKLPVGGDGRDVMALVLEALADHPEVRVALAARLWSLSHADGHAPAGDGA
jgi:hypothetical protein